MSITLQDRLEIEDVLIEILDSRDRDENNQVADLFTEDGVLAHASGYEVKGRDAMMAHFNRPGAPKAVHFTTNRRYSALSENEVQIDSYGITMGDMKGDILVNACITKDIVVREKAGWRVKLHWSDSLMRGKLVPVE